MAKMTHKIKHLMTEMFQLRLLITLVPNHEASLFLA